MIGARQALAAILLPLTVAGCGEVATPPPADAPPSAEEPEVAPAAALSDEAYLVRLGLMRGHLLVGHELHGLGALDAARTHSKHPTDELYAGMENEFAARDVAGFGAELAAHASVSQGDDAAAVDAAYAALTDAVARAEATVAASPAMIAGVIVALLREAAAEYAIGVVDGRLANAHEYQDAYGFTQIARQWATRGSASGDDAFDRMGERIDALSNMWPNLESPEELPWPADRLYGAAAEVEILALD